MVISFWISYFQWPFFPSTLGTSDWRRVIHWYVWHVGGFISISTLKNFDTQFYKIYIFHQTYWQNTVLFLFLSVFVMLLGYVTHFLQNFVNSKPMSAISLCMGCCQVVCLTEHLWPRLGAWFSPLGVTINWHCVSKHDVNMLTHWRYQVVNSNSADLPSFQIAATFAKTRGLND